MKVNILLLFGLLLLNAIAVRCEDEAEDAGNEAGEDTDTPDEESEEQEIREENSVLVLTTDNFEYAIEKHKMILVEFYAPWCGHCQSLAPEYESAAASLKNLDPFVALAKVDATVEKTLADRFEVNGFPTLKFFKDGEPIEYDGPRDATGIEGWVREKADPNWKPPADEVVVLTKDNFTEFVNEHDLSLVEFYSPWCGHCKKLAPEYSRAASFLKKYPEPPVMLAKVDATVETELASEFGVSGYPALMIFRRGKRYEYNGGRDEYSIIDYMENQIGDASKLRETSHDVKTSIIKDDVTIFGFFENEEAVEYGIYKDAVNTLRDDFQFFHSFDDSARKEFKVNKNSVVIFNPEQFHSKHEPKWKNYEMKAETEGSEIVEFVKNNCVPLVGELTMDNQQKRYKQRPLVVIFYTVDFSFEYRTATQLWRNKIVEIAKDFKDMTFAIADETNMMQMWKDFGFDESSEEMNIGILDDKQRRYPMEPMDEYDEDEIRSFIKKYKDGKVKPMIKSQPKPKKQGAVITVVGKTFEQIVFDKTKDVLLEYYAPWCGHCKKLEPDYKELGKKYKKEKDIVIAKIDGTANDLPSGFEASGFPTIFWLPKDKKDVPEKYEGGRNLDDMVEFIEKNRSSKRAEKVEL